MDEKQQKNWYVMRSLFRTELKMRANAVKCPIIAFHGTYDPHPIAGIREPMKDLENFSLIELDRCGHDPWKEKWAREAFFEKLLEEIQQ